MAFLMPLLGGIAGGLGSLFAGNEQANAAKYAANLQAQEAANSLAFQQNVFNTGQQNIAPWLSAGKGALSSLATGLGQGPGGTGTGPLNAPFTQQFQAPTAQQAAETPGYQFQLQQGENAVENSAAARGGLVSGNEATALNNYAQGTASENYGNVYNRAMQEYLNSFNIYNSNQANQFNRLASLAGVGQTAATTLGQEGQAAAGNVANIGAVAGGQIGANINNAGAATASGYAGLTNAATGTLGNIQQYQLLSQLGLLNNPSAYGGGSTNLSNALPIDPNTGMPAE